jgi:hypothetical protein
MNSTLLSFVFTLVTFGTAQAAVVCGGFNSKQKPVVLTIEETAQKTRDGFKLVNLKVSSPFSISNPIDMGRPAPTALEGCQGALMAGSRNGVLNKNYSGDLYVECDADGDAGYMELEKTGRTTYKAKFMAPNGNLALSLSDEEELLLTCNSNSR